MIDDKTIREGNELIAEFVGFERTKSGDLFIMPHDYEWAQKFMDCENYITPNLFLFHSSWDWQMPVVEQIGKLENHIYPDGMFKYLVNFKIEIGNNSVEIYGMYDEMGDKSIPHISKYENSLIENVWLAVVEFIKWYNSNNVGKV